MGGVPRWARERGGVAIAVAGSFLAGLLVGGVLGWWGPGRRAIDWGTAGEWVPGILTGAATVGALWWAISAFRVERRDREMVHALPVSVLHSLNWPTSGGLRVQVDVGNYGGAPISLVVTYAQIGERVEWMRLRGVKQQDNGFGWVDFDGITRPGPLDEVDVRVWVVFRDIEQRWWRRSEGGLPVSIHSPPPEAISGFRSSRDQAKYKAELQRMTADHDASGEHPV